MTLTTPPEGIVPEDYERIEAAVMETARGRWFLLEFARRQRAAETQQLLEAIARLERNVAPSKPSDRPASVLRDNVEADAKVSAPAPASLRLPPPTVERAVAEPPPPDPRLEALSRLDRLSLESKISLFG
ncbi:MAG: hypothetical protein WAK03_15005 [Methylocystis sp.]|jgi:hypothetical protein